MQYAPLYENDTSLNNDNFIINNDLNNNNFINDLNNNNSEPVTVVNTQINEHIKIKNILEDTINNNELLDINNKDYKNKEIDEIISKIESFQPKFMKLQDELEILNQEYNTELKNTQKTVEKINISIQFIKNTQNEYEIDNDIQDIYQKLNSYTKKLQDNDKLLDVKKRYTEKRKELNSYLYFIQKLNKWNSCAICPICITNRIDSYVNPCGHTACKECLEHNKNNNLINNNKCPICREHINDIRKIYFI
tara:strand:+ start:80 stop:829 length:750 start_codon:yes stop_codon:yes gene_type:complete